MIGHLTGDLRPVYDALCACEEAQIVQCSAHCFDISTWHPVQWFKLVSTQKISLLSFHKTSSFLNVLLHQYLTHCLLNPAEPLLNETFDPQSLRRVTYSELYSAVGDLVSALLDLGLKPGDRVGAYCSNCIVSWIDLLLRFLTEQGTLRSAWC